MQAAQGTPAAYAAKPKTQGASRVWKAFDWVTQRCQLPHPQDKTKVCGAPPTKGGGTSGHRAHLVKHHGSEWAHILETGETKTSVQMINDALAAQIDVSKPALGEKETAELNRLVALWVAKCGRPK